MTSPTTPAPFLLSFDIRRAPCLCFICRAKTVAPNEPSVATTRTLMTMPTIAPTDRPAGASATEFVHQRIPFRALTSSQPIHDRCGLSECLQYGAIALPGTAWGIKHTHGTPLRPAGGNAKRLMARALRTEHESGVPVEPSLAAEAVVPAVAPPLSAPLLSLKSKQRNGALAERRARMHALARLHAKLSPPSRAESELNAQATSWPTRAEQAQQCVHAMQSHRTHVGESVGAEDGFNVGDAVTDDCLTVM